MKKKAIYQSYNSHDCETFYKCPQCNEVFGDWTIYGQEENENGTKDYCPKCKTELIFSRYEREENKNGN